MLEGEKVLEKTNHKVVEILQKYGMYLGSTFWLVDWNFANFFQEGISMLTIQPWAPLCSTKPWKIPLQLQQPYFQWSGLYSSSVLVSNFISSRLVHRQQTIFMNWQFLDPRVHPKDNQTTTLHIAVQTNNMDIIRLVGDQYKKFYSNPSELKEVITKRKDAATGMAPSKLAGKSKPIAKEAEKYFKELCKKWKSKKTEREIFFIATWKEENIYIGN